MSKRRGRLQRKGERVYASEREREAAVALGAIRADRDKLLHDANRAFDKAIDDAKSARSEARQKVESEYEEKRSTILKAFAKDGVEADAA